MKHRYSFSFCLLLSLCWFSSLAQEALAPKPSPTAMARVRYKDAYLKITYSQPHKNGRKIFGELVPYGQVWRTGANEATELTVTKDLLINNQVLKPGTYSLFTIPEKEKWTIIVNSEPGLWGAYNYNKSLDVMRFDVAVQKVEGALFEPFTIQLEQKNELVDLLLIWDDVKVVVPMKFLN